MIKKHVLKSIDIKIYYMDISIISKCRGIHTFPLQNSPIDFSIINIIYIDKCHFKPVHYT